LHYTDIVIFVLEYFILTPCVLQLYLRTSFRTIARNLAMKKLLKDAIPTVVYNTSMHTELTKFD